MSSSNSIVYDIETVPLSDERLALCEPAHKAPSNVRDPVKIAAAVAEKAVIWRERAALSPLTGRVAMIGMFHEEPKAIHLTFANATDEELDLQEAEMLKQFWRGATKAIGAGQLLISWNGHGFDVPFLIKRSWALQVEIPPIIDIRSKWGMQPPWIDLMREWQCGDRTAEYTSLNAAAGFLGLGQKAGDCLQLRHQLEHETETAIAYLKQDLVLTEAIARRMGIIY
jgi:DNA polymerase elongation subunit (family B)